MVGMCGDSNVFLGGADSARFCRNDDCLRKTVCTVYVKAHESECMMQQSTTVNIGTAGRERSNSPGCKSTFDLVDPSYRHHPEDG